MVPKDTGYPSRSTLCMIKHEGLKKKDTSNDKTRGLNEILGSQGHPGDLGDPPEGQNRSSHKFGQALVSLELRVQIAYTSKFTVRGVSD